MTGAIHGQYEDSNEHEGDSSTMDVSRTRGEIKTPIKEYSKSPFGQNASVSQIYDRMEKISDALHLVTSHIDREEPLRMSLRRKSLDLIQHVLQVRHGLQSSGIERIATLNVALRHVMSLIHIAETIHLISPHNAKILMRALDDTATLLERSQKTNTSEALHILPSDLVPLGEEPRTTRTPKTLKDGKARTHLKDDRLIKKDSRESRGQRIVSVLGSGGNLGIKDISLNLPEYSEKMIQRELNKLVTSGTVSKTGLKRWSRYFLLR